METVAEKLLQTGLITTESRRAVEHVNGHSSAVVQNYYLHHDRTRDVHNARKVFDCVSDAAVPVEEDDWMLEPLPIELDGTSACAGIAATWTTEDVNTHISWGRDHPEFTRDKPNRVSWSAAEVQYIKEWMAKSPPGSRNKLATRCWDAVIRDTNAHTIFHAHHMLNAGRFQNGIAACMKLNN